MDSYQKRKLECRQMGKKLLISFTRIAFAGSFARIIGGASLHVLNHVGVATMKRHDQGHLHSKVEVPGLKCPVVGGENSRKVLFEQLI